MTLLDQPLSDILEGKEMHERAEFPWHAEDEKAKRPWHHGLTKAFHRKKSSHKLRVQQFTWVDWLAMVLPCVDWIREYNIKTMLLGDVIAGISVGFMIVAQGLSYATLAGVPAVYGLYGAFLPCMVYSLVGTSKQLAVGPVAVTSIIIGTSMKEIVPCAADISNPNQLRDQEQEECQALYNQHVIQLAFIVACLYTGVGVVRMGWVTNFLSHAVISGFTSGASIIIGLSQIKYILGYSIKPAKDVLNQILKEYIDKARNFKWQEFIMGCTLLMLLVAMKEGGKRFKRLRWLRTLGPISACIVGLLAVIIGHVDDYGIRVVGNIPKGLPKPTVHLWAPIEDFGKLIPVALVVMLVDLLESTSIARALARKNGYQLNYNLEIIGLGLANFAGAAFSSYTTTGSFSRSAVNDLSGSKSPLSQFVTAWVVGFVLLFLTPLFSHLPYNVLGAVVVASVVSLLEYEQAIYLFRISKLDWLCWMASFLGTLFISVEIGLGIAIGLALLLAVYQTAFPHTAVLGRVPGSTVYRNIKQYPNATVVPGIVCFRIDAALYFANVKTVQDRLNSVVAKLSEVAHVNDVPGVKYIILDFTPVSHVDAMGLHFLEELIVETRKAGQQLILANPSTKVLREMEPVHLVEALGREWVFVGTNDAVRFCSQRLAEQGLLRNPVTVTLSSEHSAVALGPSSPSTTTATTTMVVTPSMNELADFSKADTSGLSSTSSSVPTVTVVSQRKE